MKAFNRLSFATQFLVTNLLILLVGMATIGYFISKRIEDGVMNQTSAITAMYVDSFIAPRVQDLALGNAISPENISELNGILSGTPLGTKIVSFKIWSVDGEIIYSPIPELIGRSYSRDEDHQNAVHGIIGSSISELDKPENEFERQSWDTLIETYAPVRADKTGEIIAVSEFYQLPDELLEELSAAKSQSWVVVSIASALIYFVFAGIVGRASKTIDRQNMELRIKVSELTESIKKNKHLHRRVRDAASRTTSLNESFLRRIASDIHDGPVQDIALSLLRIEEVAEECKNCKRRFSNGRGVKDDLQTMEIALDSSLKELRSIASGLRLPELDDLTPTQVVERAVKNYERKIQREVTFIHEGVSDSAQLSTKITLFRIVQEALINGFRHGGEVEQRVTLWESEEHLKITVSDTGVGFSQKADPKQSNLGLAGMRERIELLGGSFIVESKPGKGTKIMASLPLKEYAKDG